MHKRAKEAVAEILEKDSSLTSREIGELLKLPTTTVHNIVARLKKEGIVEKYGAKIDRKKLGYPIKALISINLNNTNPRESSSLKAIHRAIADRIRKLGKIECFISVTGEADIVFKANFKSTSELNEFIIGLRRINSISRTITSLILEEFE